MGPLKSWWKKLFGKRAEINSRRRSSHNSLAIESLESRLALSATYAAVNDWGSGLQGQISIHNDQPAVIQSWKVEFDYTRTISNVWDGVLVSHTGNHYVVQNAAYNSTIGVGQTISFGFTAGAGTDAPHNLLLIGNGSGTTPPAPPSITIGGVSLVEGNPTTATVSGYFHTSGN
ncbi:MAG: cellulose-binding domain-containing protein, partial [Planctomycetia bacterium]|nr:cellulose-binding domain-containing protein [Planctomycetia bacterium]